VPLKHDYYIVSNASAKLRDINAKFYHIFF